MKTIQFHIDYLGKMIYIQELNKVFFFYRQQSYPSKKVFTHMSVINTSQLNQKSHLSADEIDGNQWIQCMYLRFGWGMPQGCILVPYGFRFSIAFLYNMF